MAPTKVGVNKKSQFAPTRKTINGFEPAGGCGTLNICITESAVAKAKAILHQCGPTKYKNTNPVKVDTK